MNNIGFAATKNTAVTTNNNAASSTANLNNLATAFGCASSSVGGGFNSLILSLFIQIIQTLLKNMQNKPCCDQNNKPQALPLEKLDTKKLLNALGDSGSSDNGTTTIDSIEDSDKSGELSVGDKINLKTVTRDSQTGADTVKYSSVKLTQEQLDRYQNPENLDLSDSQAAKLVETLETYFNNPALVAVKDNDNNGALSAGDLVYIKSSFELASGELVSNIKSAVKLSQEQVNRLQGPTPIHTLTLSNAEKQALDLATTPIGVQGPGGSLPSVSSVIDTDNNSRLSVGDIVNKTQYVGRVDELFGENYNFTPYSSEALTQEQLNAVNQQLSNNLNLNDSQKAKLAESLTIDYKDPNVAAVKDNDKSGNLSAADTVYLKSIETDTNGPELNSTLTKSALSISQSQVDRFQSSEAISTLELSDAQKQTLDEATSPIGAQGPGGNLPKVSSVIDTDKNGILSVGDIVNKRASAETAEEIFGDYYTYESYSSAPLTQEQLDAVNQS